MNHLSGSALHIGDATLHPPYSFDFFSSSVFDDSSSCRVSEVVAVCQPASQSVSQSVGETSD